MERNNDLDKLIKCTDDEPIIEELYIEDIKKEIHVPDGSVELRIAIPEHLMDEINDCIKLIGLNINSFCAKSFRKYLVYLKRR